MLKVFTSLKVKTRIFRVMLQSLNSKMHSTESMVT
mgnify:CR=1 FL=1